MKINKLKFIICISVLMSFNSTLASITVVKKQRASVEAEASVPIDDSFISSLDEDSLFESVTGSYNEELDFINELEPDTQRSNNNSKQNITSSTSENENSPQQN